MSRKVSCRVKRRVQLNIRRLQHNTVIPREPIDLPAGRAAQGESAGSIPRLITYAAAAWAGHAGG